MRASCKLARLVAWRHDGDAGTGLGLSVSYSIVRDHHGRIEIDGTPGRGTRLRIWLPIDASAT